MVDEAKKTYIPSLGGDNTANQLQRSVLNATALNYQKLYKLGYMEAYDKARKEIYSNPNWDCGLDYAYIHACHSLDDNSLRYFLIRHGGTYWGDEGILYGIDPLVKKTKP